MNLGAFRKLNFEIAGRQWRDKRNPNKTEVCCLNLNSKMAQMAQSTQSVHGQTITKAQQ